ncbi:MAG: DNA translocase FtsK [bacterium]|nr:DNA translocase FtsK [bacterium]
MGRKKRTNEEKEKWFELPQEIKRIIGGVILALLAVIILLSFFGKAGKAGDLFMGGALLLIGNTIFISPLIFFLAGLILLFSRKREEDLLKKTLVVFWPVVLAVIFLFTGITGILGSINSEQKYGGLLGFAMSWPAIEFFGFWAAIAIFFAIGAIGILIFWNFLSSSEKKKKKEPEFAEREEIADNLEPVEKIARPSIIRQIFAPKFKVKEIPSHTEVEKKIELKQPSPAIGIDEKSGVKSKPFAYVPPPLDLLSQDKGAPLAGDTKVNLAIIKKTLQNFGIEVTMSEVNIGPTVTQYTLKPAEGIKLSKITGLSNDLALSLASHPIRIEAPIPGRALVGVEVPNKGRAEVRLRNLMENEAFQKSPMNLTLGLGRDVAGFPVYTDLTKMPHLLVAGATGTGKTIFLNSLMASLLYQPSTPVKSAGPEYLRLIMIDPKRVEFPVYSNLPHLLCPVIYNASQTVNALRWLTAEMERRFDVLAAGKSRNIGSFNEKALKDGTDPLPFIIVIIDELADLMMVRGRDIEAGIVRLAQMARAVGIHLVVATQRPSVEVITGLIKANITSRITFQVASQIDSRTIIDCSGAEKLLGAGDMLFVSAQTPKPKRIQGAYVSDKEMRRVVEHIEKQSENVEIQMDEGLMQELSKTDADSGAANFYGNGNPSSDDAGDSLYEDAKKMVIESKKASASLLQRRLRVGYARAARLIDLLEERGVVGPQDGAKPREVYGAASHMNLQGGEIPTPPDQQTENERFTEDGWEKI